MALVQQSDGGFRHEREPHGKKAVPFATYRRSLSRRCVTNDITTQYSDDELEFLRAIDRYKRERCRPFPAWDEVLAVLRSLGYSKPSKGG